MYAIVLATMLTTGGESPHEFHGCYGCCGCWGCFGCHGVYVFPQRCTYDCPLPYSHNGYPSSPPKKPATPEAPRETGARAVLKVEVAADARLYINGQLMQTGSAERAFDTPPLEKGKTYHYTLRAEMVREGRTVSSTRRVAVRAGEETHASLLEPGGTAVTDSRR
jgi:uncharacterized protein (TIGR03000 family)